MTHPLLSLARKLEQRRIERQSVHAPKHAMPDPHLAHDLGLPYRPHPARRVDLW